MGSRRVQGAFAFVPEAQEVYYGRVFAMPSADTFSMKPARELLNRWLAGREVIVDPFARNSRRGTIRNDHDESTAAEHHLDVIDFAALLEEQGVAADALIFDPPYSPRQISEHYKRIGRPVTAEDTQSSFFSDARTALVHLIRPGGIVISAGWNSTGFGKKHGLELREVLLVNHGGAHNDTIIIVEEKRAVRHG